MFSIKRHVWDVFESPYQHLGLRSTVAGRFDEHKQTLTGLVVTLIVKANCEL